ncbi:MAG: Uma2 family endonuclease [Okeania sp. SIO2G4]|uniref:Uma2 family endonuclease n=1 Tax=unclassified Okeania TaxID=2634635 RepID=UPI0013BE24B6|nr:MULTISPECIES: Uma2 family endonuclease [unclassified Okeania]NEP07014.1 Uma2 family endonuclease [Okeania sp. SIO4D6]NEP45049.1 Uma2 family endonuclease [Okeania sp. SIO2H7]NEP73165.1 Uma2 family endonuclease [Okeania sp. SIO2G5]NEP94028.1 Uma2 family endonuclease [Okeania sp. SIO2F5]NEQ91859.1 Uma2 family endonuclease [Okeania sp. SIO2G4]
MGLFSHLRDSGIVPDVFLSLNIIGSEEWWERNVRSYLFWEFGKPPDVVIEIVSPAPGNELGSKLTDYAELRIPYYVVYDPLQKLSQTVLQVFQLYGSSYIPKNDAWFADVNLGLTLWNGVFENLNGTWLRWCDADRNVIKTGDEIAAEKNAEISQKDTEISQKNAEISQKDTEISQKNAEISQKDIQIKQALLLAIEMGLKLKFGDEYVEILSEISKIDDLKLLEALAELCVNNRFSNSSDVLNG